MNFIKGHHRRLSGVDYIEEDRGYDTPCWIWQRSMAGDSGYGMMWEIASQKQRMAHVVYYERVHGLIDPGLVLDHLCRTRNCVNPSHLEPVTMAINTRRGAHTKLTAADAEWIRANYGVISQSRMARELGVSVTCVWSVVHGLSWRDEELKANWRVWVGNDRHSDD